MFIFLFLVFQSLFLLRGEITRRGIRHYLKTNGQPYTEYIIFKNYDDGVDVYMHNSVWELDLWAYYIIDGPWEPEDWYLGYVYDLRPQRRMDAHADL